MEEKWAFDTGAPEGAMFQMVPVMIEWKCVGVKRDHHRLHPDQILFAFIIPTLLRGIQNKEQYLSDFWPWLTFKLRKRTVGQRDGSIRSFWWTTHKLWKWWNRWRSCIFKVIIYSLGLSLLDYLSMMNFMKSMKPISKVIHLGCLYLGYCVSKDTLRSLVQDSIMNTHERIVQTIDFFDLFDMPTMYWCQGCQWLVKRIQLY